MMKKIAMVLVLFFVVFSFAACGNDPRFYTDGEIKKINNDGRVLGTLIIACYDADTGALKTGANMEMSIDFELYYDYTTPTGERHCCPATVTNFVKLVNDGYYKMTNVGGGVDDYTFLLGRSVFEQNEDTEKWGLVTKTLPDYTIVGEFESNGWKNMNKWKAGSQALGMIYMVLSGDNDSANAPFGIIKDRYKTIGNRGAIFGQLTGDVNGFIKWLEDAVERNAERILIKDITLKEITPSLGEPIVIRK